MLELEGVGETELPHRGLGEGSWLGMLATKGIWEARVRDMMEGGWLIELKLLLRKSRP